MSDRRMSIFWATLIGLGMSATPARAIDGVVEYRGMCNASAAVAIGGGRYIVADDEDKPTTFLRVYQNGQPGEPLAALPLSTTALRLDPAEDLEMDLEGAARVGDRVYWIGSHSASKNAKPCPNRRRLFATAVTTHGAEVRVEVIGQPYVSLIEDLNHHDDYAGFHLKKAGELASKAPGGLSIEGLAATPDGDLLLGFRNPIPDGKALIARLKNPKGVTEGKPAKFGAPIGLNLAGLGVRSLEWSEALGRYLIVGGLPGEGPGSRLFRWSGDPSQAPKPVPGVDLTGLNPEALFFEVATAAATILSDDGRRVIDGQERDCAAPGIIKTFRGVRVNLPSPE